jgi:hypothetical protein
MANGKMADTSMAKAMLAGAGGAGSMAKAMLAGAGGAGSDGAPRPWEDLALEGSVTSSPHTRCLGDLARGQGRKQPRGCSVPGAPLAALTGA